MRAALIILAFVAGFVVGDKVETTYCKAYYEGSK